MLGRAASAASAAAGRRRLSASSARRQSGGKWYDRAGQLLPVSLLPGRSAGGGLKQLELGPTEGPQSPRERHLPLTKASLVRLLAKEAETAAPAGRATFERLAEALDAAVANRFHAGLRDLQQLFRPLNPDDDTPANLLSRRERLDGEYGFLQQLSGLLLAANFREVTREELEARLRPHASPDGVTVFVDAGRYDVLKAWTIGSAEAPPAPDAGWLSGLLRPSASGRRLHQRLVVAVRLRRSDRLTVKMFKNVDDSSIDMLLPEGNLVMSSLDRGVILTTLGAGLLGTAFSFYAWQQHLPYIAWSGAATGASLLAALRGVATYKERKARHLMRLNSLAYYGCVASNRPLLALLTERAEAEAFKEALLAYWLLLRSAPAGREQLEQAAQDWALSACGQEIDFHCQSAVDLLLSLGLARPAGDGEAGDVDDISDDRLVAIGLSQAVGQLPARPARSHWLLADQSDAFERSEFALAAESQRSRPGWR